MPGEHLENDFSAVDIDPVDQFHTSEIPIPIPTSDVNDTNTDTNEIPIPIPMR